MIDLRQKRITITGGKGLRRLPATSGTEAIFGLAE
jgi:hypothetical protein